MTGRIRLISLGTILVSLGVLLPPATAQEMYAPENFGRTGALRIEVQGAAQ